MFIVDGHSWDIPIDINRVSELTPSEVSGLLLDRTYFNDVIGTYLRYSVTLAVPVGMEGAYADLYEILNDPVGSHDFVLPYNTATVNVTGRISNISDVYVRMPNGKVHWKGIKFDVTSNNPVKTHTLDESISYGTPAYPAIANPIIGQTYIYTGEWESVDYVNADEVAY